MTNLLPRLMPRLESHHIAGLDTGLKSFHPRYDRQSLVNLPASICHWLGVPRFGQPPLLDAILEDLGNHFRQVILVVMDGLGLEQFERFTNQAAGNGRRAGFWQQLLSEAMLAPLTSVVPSTTSSALTTLWTGRSPAEHGVIGYEVYLKEYGLTANMILHSPASFVGDVGGLRRAGFNPETFLNVPTLGTHLAQHGVKSYAFQHASIAHSGLTTMLFPQVNVMSFRTLSDLWVSVPEHFEKRQGERIYTYIYWSELDELSHRFGPFDRRVDLEFSHFSTLFEDFITSLRRHVCGDTLLLLTADHGHLLTPANPRYEFKNHPKLASCLHMTPSGENRLAFLYLRPGKEQQARDYIEQAFPGEFALLSAEQVLDSHLMGEGQPHPRLAERLGDWVMVAQDSAYLWWADKENLMLGRHGGMSRTEMLVPLLGWVI